MTAYVPPGTLPLSTVLARLAEAWMPEMWATSPPPERGVLLEEPLDNFRHKAALQAGTLPDLTYARLRPMLADGRLPALLHVQVGPPRFIPPSSWQGDGASDLRALLGGRVGFVLDGGAVDRGAVLVTEDALAALLEGRVVPVSVRHMPAASEERFTIDWLRGTDRARPQGGNRSRPDADLFWIEVCRHVKDGDVPGTVSAFAEVMERWAAANMRQPYELETIRKKLGLMFRTIGWNDI